MATLNVDGQQQITTIAQRYNISNDSANALLDALVKGGGSMAQFNISELGGNGQWMKGGMTMVGDMFNSSLKNKVNSICQDLSELLKNEDIFEKADHSDVENKVVSDNWWPQELGSPSSSGSQNNLRYAIFSAPISRLALQINSKLAIYDTLDYHISGISQQQGANHSIVFSSQKGTVDISKLPLLSGKSPTTTSEKSSDGSSEKVESSDIFSKIERLSELHKKGVLSDLEFSTKKAELLERL